MGGAELGWPWEICICRCMQMSAALQSALGATPGVTSLAQNPPCFYLPEHLPVLSPPPPPLPRAWQSEMAESQGGERPQPENDST